MIATKAETSMMKERSIYLILMSGLAAFVLVSGCDSSITENGIGVDAGECSIPENQLDSGGVGKDGIP
ncbi:MAG: hypothetical protein WD275_06645, partial [Rhodothermales bacterium]